MARLNHASILNLSNVVNSRCVVRSKFSSSNDNIIDLLLTMPRESRRARLKHMREKQTQMKEKNKHAQASTIYLQVVGSGANGTPRAFSVFTTHQRYLFNCGEGTQRIANEHKVRLSKLENIFITHKSWENMGGLPGLTLTLQDIGIPQITLHGPPGIENLYKMTRGFLVTKHIKIAKHQHTDPPYEDGALKIENVPLISSEQVERISDCGSESSDIFEDALDHFSDQESTSTTPRPQSPKTKKLKLSSEEQERHPDISVAYICRPHTLPGHLQLDKCVEFGVPVGPLLSQLKNGNDITLPNGTVVKSRDVVSPEEPGPIFIILECPSKFFLDALLTAPEFFSYQTESNSRSADIIVHFTPSDIMKHPKYKEWMKRFPRETNHLVINDLSPGIANLAAHRIQYKLNLLDNNIFPLLSTTFKMPANLEDYECGKVTYAEPLLQYHIRPHNGFDRSGLVSLQPEEFLKEVYEIPGSMESLEKLKKSLKKFSSLDGSDYPQITFLGTGSSIPSKVRNVSSILIRLSINRWMLLDCGEGTYGQILRFYGSTVTEDILKNMIAIFISHLHADHHMGLIKILHEREKVMGKDGVKKIHLVAPQQIKAWLKRYHNEFSPIMEMFNLVANYSILHDQRELDDEKFNEVLRELQMKEFSTVFVRHCLNAFGIIFTHQDGWKLVYSGDTMPCDNLVQAGLNCDILIHEATMEDELVDDARHKTHSTTSQAIEVGRQMKAKFTMLTHFSQRYAKVPIFTDKFHASVGVAFDNMKVSLKNLVMTPFFNSILKVIFVEDYEDMEEQRERKQKRKQLLEETNDAANNSS